MRSKWTVRVYISKSSWWEWQADTEALALIRYESIKAKGFNDDRPRGRGRRHYLPAAILWIDIIPPTKNAEVPA